MQKQGNTEKYENDKYHKLHHDRTFPSITRCLLLDWLLRLRHQGSALPQPGATQVYVYNYLYICLVYVQIHRLKDRHKAYLYIFGQHKYLEFQVLVIVYRIITSMDLYVCVLTKVQIHAIQIGQDVSIPKTSEHKTQPFLSQRQQNAPSQTTILWMPSSWFDKYKLRYNFDFDFEIGTMSQHFCHLTNTYKTDKNY